MTDLNHFNHFHVSAGLLNVSNRINKYIPSAKTAFRVEGAILNFQLDFPPYTECSANR